MSTATGTGPPLADDVPAGPAPPAPVPPAHDLPWWRAVVRLGRNPITAWPQRCYEERVSLRRVLGRAMVLVSDPALIPLVLGEGDGATERPVASKRLLRPAIGNGVLLAEGADWRRQRRILAPAFTPRHIATLVPHFVAGAERLLARLAAGDRTAVNLAAALQEAALDIAARTMFSASIDGRAASIAANLARYQRDVGRFTVWDLLARREGSFPFALRGRGRFRRSWFAEVDRVIAERRALAAPRGARPADVLDLLEAARDPDTGEGLAPDEIRDQVATLLGAGFETTARALFWTCYLLALYPAHQERVAAEVHAQLGAGPATTAALDAMPLLRATLLEAMRLYPPAAVVSRQATRDLILDGIAVPRGSFLSVAPWVLHRHRRLWAAPDAFRPARFVGRERDILQGGAYIPFGTGPRVCLGAAFATTEALTVLAMLLARERIELADSRPLEPIAIITTVPSIEPRFRLVARTAGSGTAAG
jgi:cytochrome P450